MGARIRENVSPNPPKRDRPPLIPPGLFATLDGLGLFAENTTRRGRNNVHYRQRALAVLGNAADDDFSWICDRPAMQRGDPKAWRPSIMIELGRIAHDDDLIAVARRVCELKPKAAEAWP